jgi:hypothetical protein
MTWQYVGGTSGAGTSTAYTVSLNGTLTGGMASSPAAGDLVVVFSGFGNTASSAPAISGNNSGAYNVATAAQHVNDTWDTEFRSFYRVMGATPDTTLTVTRTTNAAYGGATTVQVWRGVDGAAPFIGAATPATGTNTSLVNPPAYNPGVTDALIIAGGAGTQATTGAAFTGFTGMSNFLTRKGDGSTSDIDVAMASYAYAGVSYDPPIVSGGTGGNASSSWAGVTIAFRRYVAPTLGIADGGHGHSADAIDQTTGSYIAVQDGAHAHAADNLDLVPVSGAANLVIAEAAHAHAAESPSLTTQSLLAVQEVAHSHMVDALALSSRTGLTVQEASHAQTAKAPTLTAQSLLAVQEGAHAHAADNLTLTADTSTSLLVAEAAHAHAAEAPALTTQGLLAVQEAGHSHMADAPALNMQAFLLVAECAHGQQADSLDLATSAAIELFVAGAWHAQRADTPLLWSGPLPASRGEIIAAVPRVRVLFATRRERLLEGRAPTRLLLATRRRRTLAAAARDRLLISRRP